MNLKETAKEIYENAKAKGFWDEERNLGEMLMLIVSEVSEALEADRKGRHCNPDSLSFTLRTWHRVSDIDRDETIDDFKDIFESSVKDTFEDEMADAVIRILDLCHSRGINLEDHIRAKMAYNSTRPHKHGKKY